MNIYSFLVLLVLVIFLVFDADGIITWKLSDKKQDTDLIISKQVCIVIYLIVASIYIYDK